MLAGWAVTDGGVNSTRMGKCHRGRTDGLRCDVVQEGRKMTDQRNETRPIRMTEWARRQAPHLSEVSGSTPDPELEEHNLVAVTHDLDTAHSVALAFERVRLADSEVSTVVLGHPVDRTERKTADPEGVTTHAAKWAGLSAIPGAVIGALVIGLAVFFVTDSAAGTIGAAVGGAFFGAYVSGTWGYVIGTGQSRAYEQTFVDPEATDVVFVSVHGSDESVVRAAEEAASEIEGIRLRRVDRGGRLLD